MTALPHRPATPHAVAHPFETVHRSAVHAALEAIVTVDEAQRIVMINPAAQRMFGISAAQALGSDLSQLIPARHRTAHAAHVRGFGASAFDELPMGQRGTVSGLRANGEEFPLEASISRVDVAGESGVRRYYTALLRDLSEVQAFKAEVESMNRRVRAIFELAPIAIWITDEERIVFANHACAALFGATDHAELVGRSIYALLRPESHRSVREKVAQALSSGSLVPAVTERIARLDGTVRDVEIAVAGLPDHGRTALQMVITDITERTRESRHLESSRRELRRLSSNLVNAREEERRRIARELHDELGQRLTALKMELASLAAPTSAGVAAERLAPLVDMVDETVASVRRIATELRPLMLDDLGLNAAIEWLTRDSARRLGIEITLSLDDSDAPIGAAATIGLYRMVQEALTNIARHSQASQAHIQTRLTGAGLELTVQDNGVGFTDESMHREGSHGLMGLRERALMLGGELEVGNLPGGGACITVRLPLRVGQDDAAPGRGLAAAGAQR